MTLIKIKYHTDITPIEKVSYGDWIDLRAAETVTMKAGEFKIISLGVSMQLPANYEALVIPRSSTFKTWGVLQANSVGLIDNSYCGDNDIWGFPAYATRDCVIEKDSRICQFRIQPIMAYVDIIATESLGNESRGGFGSSGVK